MTSKDSKLEDLTVTSRKDSVRDNIKRNEKVGSPLGTRVYVPDSKERQNQGQSSSTVSGRTFSLWK